MSMESNITELFKIWHKENKWSEEKTIGYFWAIYGALEWNITDNLMRLPEDEKGNVDWDKVEKIEYKKAKRILFGGQNV